MRFGAIANSAREAPVRDRVKKREKSIKNIIENLD